jgi:hypothetical protein
MSASIDIGHDLDSNTAFLSPAKINAKSFAIGTCQYINTLNLSTMNPGKPFRTIGALPDGGLKPDRTYFLSADGSHLIPDSGIFHLHNSDATDDGGLYRKVRLANFNSWVNFDATFPRAAMFKAITQGTSSAADAQDNLTLTTGTATGDFIQIRAQGGTIDLGQQSAFAMYGYSPSNTKITVKMGVGMENVSVQEGLDRRYGLEACDTANTPRQYSIVSSNGVGWDADPTTEEILQTAPKGLTVIHNPNVSVNLSRYVSNLETVSVKTTNVPNSGTVDPGKVVSAGFKTNESVQKFYFIYAMKMEGAMPTQYFSPVTIL